MCVTPCNPTIGPSSHILVIGIPSPVAKGYKRWGGLALMVTVPQKGSVSIAGRGDAARLRVVVMRPMPPEWCRTSRRWGAVARRAGLGSAPASASPVRQTPPFCCMTEGRRCVTHLLRAAGAAGPRCVPAPRRNWAVSTRRGRVLLARSYTPPFHAHCTTIESYSRLVYRGVYDLAGDVGDPRRGAVANGSQWGKRR